MIMAVSQRCASALFTLGLHGLLAMAVLGLPQRGASAPDTVYQVSWAQVSPAGGAAAPEEAEAASGVPPARAEAAPQPDPQPAPQPETPAPVPVPVAEKVVSPKKTEEPEKKPPAPRAATPRRQETPATTATVNPPPETGTAGAATAGTGTAGAATAGTATESGLRNVGGLAAYSAEAVDQAPAVARRVLPAYPPKARRLDMQGRVVVRLVVDAGGAPQACAVHQADPPGYFEEAALDAARRTRFIPGKLRGQAVNTVVLLPFTFSLR